MKRQIPPNENELERQSSIMRLVIERFKEGRDYTIGIFTLYTDNGLPRYNGFSLEPAGTDEVRSGLDRRIPQGIYTAVFEYSPKFTPKYGVNLPVIFNEKVSKNRRILIHIGNKGDDTEGCILLGDSYAPGYVYDSKNTFNKFLQYLNQQDFQVEIINKGV